MPEMSLVVTNKVGLHARPASLFVQCAKKYKAKIEVQNKTAGSKVVDAKSILGVLTLGVLQNHEVWVRAEGEDAGSALDALRDLVESNFGEGA